MPLGLASNDGLGRTLPQRAAFWYEGELDFTDDGPESALCWRNATKAHQVWTDLALQDLDEGRIHEFVLIGDV